MTCGGTGSSRGAGSVADLLFAVSLSLACTGTLEAREKRYRQ